MEPYKKIIIENIYSILEEIKNNGEYIICLPDKYKKLLLKEISSNPLSYNVKLLTIEEFIAHLTVQFDENAIYYLMDKYQYNYDTSSALLNNLYYGKIIKDELPKVLKLKSLYEELTNKDFLKNDDLFKETLKDKKLVILGYNEIKREYLEILDSFYKQNNMESYTHFIFSTCNNNELEIYECINIEDELHLILDKISKLIFKGVSLDKIKIMGINNIERARLLFSLYNIPVNFDEDALLSNYKIFDDKLVGNIEVNELSDEELLIYQQMVDCLNGINFEDDSNQEVVDEIIFRKLKQLKIRKDKQLNAVEVIHFDSYLDSYLYKDCYLFICGINEGILPKLIKDEDYFKDAIKEKNNITTSYQENYHTKKEFIKLLKNCQYVCGSYSLFGDSQLYPSSIIKELGVNIRKYKDKYSLYSDEYNKILLIRNIDLMKKYGIISNELIDLYNTYLLDDYLKYDNTFKVKDQETYLQNIKKIYEEKIKLSYSSMDTYNKCPFAFYIENVLKLNKFENNFPLFIGNLYHYVLEKVFSNNNYDELFIDKLIKDYIEESNGKKDNFALQPKEQFLLKRLVKELKEVIKVIVEQNTWIKYSNALYEKKISIQEELEYKGFKTIKEFNGIIDKVYYQEIKNDEKTQTYVTLVDYKTGIVNIKLDLIEYGLSMQLPVYIYLLKESKLFENIKIGGIFIQNILNKDYKTEKLDDRKMEQLYYKERYNSLKLDGYLCNDNGGFDSTEENSLIIKGLRKTKEGFFYANSKVLSNDEIDNIFNVTKNIINNTYKMILDGYFPIKPKLIEKKFYSCEFCKYNDLCYKTYKDVSRISIRGEDNA